MKVASLRNIVYSFLCPSPWKISVSPRNKRTNELFHYEVNADKKLRVEYGPEPAPTQRNWSIRSLFQSTLLRLHICKVQQKTRKQELKYKKNFKTNWIHMFSVEIRCYLQKGLRQSAAAETPARTPSTPRDPISKGKSLLWERQERILNKICPFQINLYSGTHDRPRWSLLRGGGWWRWWLTVGWGGQRRSRGTSQYSPAQLALALLTRQPNADRCSRRQTPASPRVSRYTSDIAQLFSVKCCVRRSMLYTPLCIYGKWTYGLCYHWIMLLMVSPYFNSNCFNIVITSQLLLYLKD